MCVYGERWGDEGDDGGRGDVGLCMRYGVHALTHTGDVTGDEQERVRY